MSISSACVCMEFKKKVICPFQVENIVAAEYELEHLLLEGHCFDVSSGQPPRGLQFTLGTASEPVIVDTIVMANLVSFQPPLIHPLIFNSCLLLNCSQSQLS